MAPQAGKFRFPGKEVQKNTLSVISWVENIFMHKVTSSVRYDLNTMV